jgi:hypothetical protein
MRISMTPILSSFSPQCRLQSRYELDFTVDQPRQRARNRPCKTRLPSQTRFDSTTSRLSAHHNNAGTFP